MKNNKMKAVLNATMFLLAGAMGFSGLSARGELEVSASVNIHAAGDFYEPLTACGAWVQVGTYGRCWRPAGVAVEWRPYAYGHWVWTDCGWYWVSDEPWAWACYHYGWWVYDPVYFWVWVPGIEWGPAWVCWRVGGGYIGWAPLAPRGVRVAVAGPEFAFVATTHFLDPLRPGRLMVNNTTIIKQTTLINNITRENMNLGGRGPQKVVVNHGPGLEGVEKATGRKVAVMSVLEADRRTPAPGALKARHAETRKDNVPAAPGKPSPSGTEVKPAPGQNHEPFAPPQSGPRYGERPRKGQATDEPFLGGAEPPEGGGEGHGQGHHRP